MFDPHAQSDAPPIRATGRRPCRLAVALISLSLVAITGCGDDAQDAGCAAAAPASATATTATRSPATGGKASAKPGRKASARKPEAIVKEARTAVDRDDYAGAVSLAASLPAAERRPIGQRIANRLARRARGALQAGNRSAVLSLLAQSRTYPKTALMRKVRADYVAAEKAFERRGDVRLINRTDRLRRAKAEREARRARARAIAAQATSPE